MAQNTTRNSVIPADRWIDIYDLPEVVANTAITTGTKIQIVNISGPNMRLNSGANNPGSAGGYLPFPEHTKATNQDGDAGAWVYSRYVQGLINVNLPAD